MTTKYLYTPNIVSSDAFFSMVDNYIKSILDTDMSLRYYVQLHAKWNNVLIDNPKEKLPNTMYIVNGPASPIVRNSYLDDPVTVSMLKKYTDFNPVRFVCHNYIDIGREWLFDVVSNKKYIKDPYATKDPI